MQLWMDMDPYKRPHRSTSEIHPPNNIAKLFAILFTQANKMQSYFNLAILIGLGCVSLSTPLKMKQPTCRGTPITITEETMKGMAACMAEITPEVKTEEDMDKMDKTVPKEKMACLGKCIMTKEGALDDKGMPSKDKMIAKIDSSMPKEVAEELDAAIGKCVDDNGAGVHPDDASCMSYQPLTQCITVAWVEACKSKE